MRAVMIFAIAFGVMWATPAGAQTHPCDQTAPTSTTVSSSSPHKAVFCAKPADAPEAFTVYTNGTASDLRPLTMTVAPNATGYALYEGPRELQFTKGSYSIQVSLWNVQFPSGPSQESAKSAPLSLAAVDDAPPAAAPKLMDISR